MAAVVVIGVVVVAVVLRLRTQRRGVKAVVASHHARPSKLSQKYDNVDLKTDILYDILPTWHSSGTGLTKSKLLRSSFSCLQQLLQASVFNC